MHATKKQKKVGLPQTWVKQSVGTVQVLYADFLDEKRSHLISKGGAEFGIAGDVAGFRIAKDVAGFGIAKDVAGFGIAGAVEILVHKAEDLDEKFSTCQKKKKRTGI